jgi:endonuclease G, mitochondrial
VQKEKVMNSRENIAAHRQQIAELIKDRYAQRAPDREERLRQAKALGALAAASRRVAIGRTSHLTVNEGRNLEAATGNYDIDQINFLSRGLKAARAVCRIVNAGYSWGTGFIVAPGLLLTNHHVLPDMESAQSCDAQFNYELDAEDAPLRSIKIRLAPEKIFVTSLDTHFDFTIVALDDPQQQTQALGWLPLDPRVNKIVEGEPAVSIQHPGQEDKKICLFESVLVDRVDDPDLPYLYYTTDTERGSSGSPVFNRNWQVVALHHGSVKNDQAPATNGLTRPATVNEGIRISRLLQALRTGDRVTEARDGHRADVLTRITDRANLGDSRPQGPPLQAAQAGPAQPQHAMGLPLIVSPATRAGAGYNFSAEGAATLIKSPPLSHYRGRRGYSETFLGGGSLRVPLPALAPALQDDVAPLLRASSASVLKYMHYSVVMSASRRTAYFSACNLDGATNPKAFDRKRRVVFESARTEVELERAADRWYYDPRMAREHQPEPVLFDDSPTHFDFGHITRRMDAVWGADEDEMLLGSDDSFHMTNCAPQVSSYNQHGDWGSLEDAIASFARGKGEANPSRKVCVISGPVLHPLDPELLGLKVPRSFWKVIAYEEDSQLRALAFLTSQGELVEVERRKLETTRVLVRKAFDNEWLTTVRDVSRLTSLDFGPLADADWFAAQGGTGETITAQLLDSLFG